MGPGVTPRNCSRPSGVVVHGSDFRLMMHVTAIATTLTITTIITQASSLELARVSVYQYCLLGYGEIWDHLV